jgi:hypothetical protein
MSVAAATDRATDTEVRHLRLTLEDYLREIGKGVLGASGAADAYLESRRETLHAEADRLQASLNPRVPPEAPGLADTF